MNTEYGLVEFAFGLEGETCSSFTGCPLCVVGEKGCVGEILQNEIHVLAFKPVT